jgi:hypothetical protein
VARFVARGWIPLSVVAAALITAADADAFVVKKTSSGQLVHWEEREVSYAIDPSVDANVPQGSQAAKLATEGWSGSVGAPEMRTHASDATSPTKPGFDNKNGVFFMANGWAPAGKALAITVLTYDNASGKILDADVIVNGSYTFAVLDASNPMKRVPTSGSVHAKNTDGITHEDETVSQDVVYDLYHVVAHEFGHSLGMNDELDRHDALMYRYSSPNDASMRQPGNDDIEGLAELYSTRLEGTGNGCGGGATVSPKKPALGAQHAAMVAALGLLLFLVIRARNDRRARYGFVLAAAAAALVLLPSSSKKDGVKAARAGDLAPGNARARVLETTTSMESGLFKTTYKLATTICRASTCPDTARGEAWGGTMGSLRQEVGGQFAPTNGDEVDVTFRPTKPTKQGTLAELASPLAAKPPTGQVVREGLVRVLTPAR